MQVAMLLLKTGTHKSLRPHYVDFSQRFKALNSCIHTHRNTLECQTTITHVRDRLGPLTAFQGELNAQKEKQLKSQNAKFLIYGPFIGA